MPRFVLIFLISAALTMALLAFLFLRPSTRGDTLADGVAAPPAAAVAPVAAPPPAATPGAPPARPSSAPRRPSATTAAPAAPETAAPAPSTDPVRGTITIQADVPGAQVFIDRRFVGTAPATIDDLEPGQHRLNVSAEGFDGFAETIDVQAGAQEMTVRLREVRLSATLPVVHKHRIGSCTGRLVATPEGLSYETANREDGFTTPLNDIDTFEVDYQDRNLRIKLRKGREYNFTDPEGNADRLFVFHRDVDRARTLLAKGYEPASN